MARALRFRCLTWWRSCQATLGSSDPTNRAGWKHPIPGYKTRWEEPLEKLDADWITRASDRDTWRSLRGRFVSTLLSRHHCRNSVYHPTARDAPLAPENEQLNAVFPEVRPLLSPCVTPAFFSPAFSRPARSIHLTCFGSCPSTVSHILGDPKPGPPDALLYNLRPRVLKSLLQLSSLCNCLPKEILVCGSPSAYATAKLLAEKSLDDGISLEKSSQWPENLPTETCHITAQFYGCCDRLGNGSALQSSWRPVYSLEIFHCRVCLGSQCTLQTATYQACGFLLHALLSLFSLLSPA